MSPSSGGFVNTEVNNGIGWITFAHPAHNALTLSLLRDLSRAFQQMGTDSSVKAIVLKSGGDRTFCAGANLTELASIQNLDEAISFFMGFAGVINAMRTCGKLVIGRLQGKVVGGGVGLAAATDYCMATKWSSVRLSEISLGIGPFVIEPAIRRKMGLSSLSQLALNPAAWQTAVWAKDKGLFHEVFDTTDLMDDYLRRYLDRTRTYDVASLTAMKKVLWEGSEQWDVLLFKRAEISGQLLLSDYCQQALKSLKNNHRT